MAFLAAVKQELEWENGISIPLTNPENKLLEEEIQNGMKEISTLTSLIDIQKEHISAIANHLTHLHEQLNEVQSLYQAKQQEIEYERHLQSLLSQEESRISQEIRWLKKEFMNTKEKTNLHKNSVTMLERKLDTIRENIHWDQKAIDCWLEDAIMKDDDAVLLQTYMQEDTIKIKELELQLEKLNSEEQQKKRLIDKAAIDLRLSQMDLDKTAEEFKQAHLERQKCLHQWETTVQQMKKRDNEVEYYILEILTVKDQLQNAKQMQMDKDLTLNNVKKINIQLEKDVAKAEKVVCKLQVEKTDAIAKQREMEQEIAVSKVTFNRSNVESDKVHNEIKQVENMFAEQTVRLDQEKKILDKVSKEVQHKSATIMSTEEYIQQLDNFMAHEKFHVQMLAKERGKLNDVHSVEAQHLQVMNEKNKQQIAEVQALKSLLQKYIAANHKLDEELQNQTQVILNQDAEISFLTGRSKIVEGNDELKKQHEWQSRLLLMQQVLTAKQSSCLALNQEIKQQQDDLRLAQKELQKCIEQKTELESKLNSVNLHNEISSKQLKEIFVKNQKLLVDENILKLEIRRLREIIGDKSTNALSLEKQRLTLETTIRERQQEIDIERESLKTEIRLVEEGRQRLTVEYNSCISQTEKLKKRCEIMLMPLKSWKYGEETEPVHFLLKAAEDKDSLKKETKELQSKVLKAEKELLAFKSTAQLLQEKNERLRKNLTSAVDNVILNNEKKKLEEQLQIDTNKLEVKKTQLTSVQKNLMMRQDILEDLIEEEHMLDSTMKEKQQMFQLTEVNIEDQCIKLSRADQKLTKLSHELEANPNLTGLIEDVKLRLIREHNKNTVSYIRDWMDKYPEIATKVETYFEKANLPPPPKTSKTRRYSTASNKSLNFVHATRALPSLTNSPTGTPPSTGRRSTSSTVSLPSVVNLTFDEDSKNAFKNKIKTSSDPRNKLKSKKIKG